MACKALPQDGKLITLESDPAYADVAKKNIARAKLQSIVEIRTGKALDTLPQIKAERLAPFDMIFIDADKPHMPNTSNGQYSWQDPERSLLQIM